MYIVIKTSTLPRRYRKLTHACHDHISSQLIITPAVQAIHIGVDVHLLSASPSALLTAQFRCAHRHQHQPCRLAGDTSKSCPCIILPHIDPRTHHTPRNHTAHVLFFFAVSDALNLMGPFGFQVYHRRRRPTRPPDRICGAAVGPSGALVLAVPEYH